MIKSTRELEYVRRAGDLGDAALKEAIRLAEPGVSEVTILAAMQAAVLAGDGDYPACEFIIGSGAYAQLVRYRSGRQHSTRKISLPSNTYIVKNADSALISTAKLGIDFKN